jgi:hypothetical protein
MWHDDPPIGAPFLLIMSPTREQFARTFPDYSVGSSVLIAIESSTRRTITATEMKKKMQVYMFTELGRAFG